MIATASNRAVGGGQGLGREPQESGPEVLQRGPNGTGGNLGDGLRLVNKEEAAGFLHVSVRTVDALMAEGEIPYLKLRHLVRFYLPDVVRALTATALTRKRGRRAGTAVES